MCKKHLFIAFLLFSMFSGYAQTIYRPGTHVVVNDAVAPTPAVPLDARTMKYDSINFLYRAYNGTTEVLTYLNTANYRSGNFIMVVDSGGALQSNGTYIGGYNTFYMFKDSTTAGGLVKMNLFGMGSGVCTSCLQAANNLSDLASLATALINLGLNNVNNTSDAAKNSATVALTNHTISGASNTLTNIPNSALNNSTIGLTVTSTSASDISVTTTPAALGTSLVVNIPTGGTASRGPISATNWNFFNGKLDSVHVSNDSVYNCVNGTCTLQSVISGTGGVNSVNPTDPSLLFSPTTGNVLGQVNPAWNPNWTGQHTFVSFAPIFSSLTTPGGLFYGNGSGQVLQSGAGTTGQILESQGGTAPVFFLPNSTTVAGWLGYTPLSASLGSSQIYVGNSLNTAAAVNVSGDVTLSNTGVVTITKAGLGPPGAPVASLQFNDLGTFRGSSHATYDSVNFRVAADTLLTHRLTFYGDAPSTLIEQIPVVSGLPFNRSLDQSFTNPNGHPDNILGYMLHNMIADGAATVTDRQAYGEYLESDFQQGGSDQMERHWVFGDTTGRFARVKSWLMPFGNAGGTIELNSMASISYFQPLDELVPWFGADNSGHLVIEGGLGTQISMIDTIATGGQFSIRGNADGSVNIANTTTGSNPAIAIGNALNVTAANAANPVITVNTTAGSGGIGYSVNGSVTGTYAVLSAIIPVSSFLFNEVRNTGTGGALDYLSVAPGSGDAFSDYQVSGGSSAWLAGENQSDGQKYKITYNDGAVFTGPNAMAIDTTETSTGGNSVCFGCSSMNPAVKLQLVSLDKGFLEPAMSTAQQQAILGNPDGNQVYDTDLHVPSWYNSNQSAWIYAGEVVHTIFTPTTGNTITLQRGAMNIINPAGPLAALTIQMPTGLTPNDFVEIKFTQAITTLTFAGTPTVVDPLSAATAGLYTKYAWDSSSWY